MEYMFWWLLLAIPCFFVAYCNGADMDFRLNSPCYEDGFWKFHKNFFSEGFHLLVHDYFGVYCPWSWERAKRHRLADMRIFLGESGRCHERLGHIIAADCDNPEKQEIIARHTYISRTAHWTRGVFHFIIAPIPGSFIIVGTAIAGVVELGRYLVGKST